MAAGCSGIHRYLKRNRLGHAPNFTRDGGGMVTQNAADPPLWFGEFKGTIQVRYAGDDVREGERHLGYPDIQEAVPERIDLVPVYIGYGAVSGHVEVAGNQADADHGAGLQLTDKKWIG